MRVGAARIDITPDFPTELAGYAAREQPAVGVLHPIYVRAAAFEHDRQRVVVISIETCEITRSLADDMRGEVAQAFGIDADYVCITCTHTHSAPPLYPFNQCGSPSERYTSLVRQRVVACARQAGDNLAPAKVVHGRAPLAIGQNRRHVGVGAFDGELRVLTALGENDRPVAMLLHHACHPVCMPVSDRLVSGDCVGIACEALERRFGEGCVTMFIQGCAGDINPRDPFRFTQTAAHDAGMRIADAATPLVGAIESHAAVDACATIVALPYARLDRTTLHEQLAELNRSAAGENFAARAQRIWLATCLRDDCPTAMPVGVQILRLGAVRWIVLSGEVLYGIAQRLERACPGAWIAAYAHGGHGYIPTRDAQHEGGYEPHDADFYYNRPHLVEGVDDMLVDAAAKLCLGR